MRAYVLGFQELDRTDIAVVGGKGANLGELSRVDGLRVPDGFCVTTDAFRRVLHATPAAGVLLDQLARMQHKDLAGLRELASALRTLLEEAAIPADVQEPITRVLARSGPDDAYAVRSSATAEDMPDASFAGQQDTYLNVVGVPSILKHLCRCWASLFTERAVVYRNQHGFDHRKVHMAVVVQKMLRPQAAGILFTADPITGHRKVSSIEAGFGLGEALVSGAVNADGYKVRDGKVIARNTAIKRLVTWATDGGGTETRPLEADRQELPVLTDAQAVRLAEVGRRIEKHFGHPQDIEWCLVDGEFHVVQARPITTLYPVPPTTDDRNHVFISVGHQQMMTDAIKPLGVSLFQLTAAREMLPAGGRLFVDPTLELSSPASRDFLLNMMGDSDPLLRDALQTLLDRGDFIEPATANSGAAAPPPSVLARPPAIDDDPAIVTELVSLFHTSLETLKREIKNKSGTELVDFIQQDIEVLKKLLKEPRSIAVIMAGMNAATWLNQNMMTWLGEKGAADTLSQSVAHNVTSEMGLALLDLADVIRPHAQVVAYLQGARDDGFLEGMLTLEGGTQVQDAFRAYLDKYGMRGAGEIDVTRTRWRESPTTLVPLLLGNIRNFEPGEGRRRFEQGKQEAARKERELLERLRQLPDGEQKATETQRMISRLRMFIGYREYPKYGMVSRSFVHKQALMAEAARLVRADALQSAEDIFFLALPELRELVRTYELDERIITSRKAEHEWHRRLSPPRVITSDGEVITGTYKRTDVPAGAWVGLAVSAGSVEGRARVVLDMAHADLAPGDILVTAFTDPSWTPLFVSITGLVTEVGGLMTHGAVIAREYGLPAVVGVENATRLIKDGQRIRVNGTDGFVEVLE